MMPIKLWIGLVLGLWNAITLAVMGVDKRRAQRGMRRVRERTLWRCAMTFGAPGACLGMWLLRHKTRHLPFAAGLPALAAAQIIIFYIL